MVGSCVHVGDRAGDAAAGKLFRLVVTPRSRSLAQQRGVVVGLLACELQDLPLADPARVVLECRNDTCNGVAGACCGIGAAEEDDWTAFGHRERGAAKSNVRLTLPLNFSI